MVACCAEDWELLSISCQSLVVEKLEISKEYSGFALSVMTRSSTTADCQPFWREIYHTSALYSLLANPPSKVTTNLV